MFGRRLNWFALAVVFCLVIGPAGYALKLARTYTLTIYVDEGHGSLNGHVFMSLSNGADTAYYGFYARDKTLALLSMGDGEVRNDARLASTGWDVKKTFQISSNDYMRAHDAIAAWRRADESWWIDHHCGDFVEMVSKEAGVELDLSWTYEGGRNRPGLFGQHLRNTGGTVRNPNKLELPEPSRPIAPEGAASVDLNGSWRADGYVGGEEALIIRHYGRTVSAVKTKGNQFIKSGDVTWRGEYTGNDFAGYGQAAYCDENGNLVRKYLVDVTISVRGRDKITISGPEFRFTTCTRIRE